MKKKYIITGILVFLFSAISIYLILDTGRPTYAIDGEEDNDATRGNACYYCGTQDGFLWGDYATDPGCQNYNYASNSDMCSYARAITRSGCYRKTVTASGIYQTNYITITASEAAPYMYLSYIYGSTTTIDKVNDSYCTTENNKCYYVSSTNSFIWASNLGANGATEFSSATTESMCNNAHAITTAGCYKKTTTANGSAGSVQYVSITTVPQFYISPYNGSTITYDSVKASDFSLTPSGSVEINKGSTQTFTVSPSTTGISVGNVIWKTSANGIIGLSAASGNTTIVTGLSVGGPNTLTATITPKIGSTQCANTVTKTVDITVKGSSNGGGTGGDPDSDCSSIRASHFSLTPSGTIEITNGLYQDVVISQSNAGSLAGVYVGNVTWSLSENIASLTTQNSTTTRVRGTSTGTATLTATITPRVGNTMCTNTVTKTVDITVKGSSNGGGNGGTQYTIKYDCGTVNNCTLPPTTYGNSSPVTIASTAPTTSQGYKFEYWTTTVSSYTFCNSGCSSNKVYFSNGVTEITLYAQWKKTSSGGGNTTYTLNYDCGEGVECSNLPSPNPVTQTNNNTFTISSTQPTREGYTFLNWTKKNGSYTYCSSGCNSSTITLSNQTSTTLYANWKRNEDSGGNHEYIIKYSCGDNIKCDNLPSDMTANETPVTISDKIPTRDGYTFLYWTTSVSRYKFCNPSNSQFDCGRNVYFQEDDTIVLTAAWELNLSNNPNEPSESSIESSGGETNPGTGSIPVYIAFAVGLSMLGYSYYYTKKLKEN